MQIMGPTPSAFPSTAPSSMQGAAPVEPSSLATPRRSRRKSSP